MNSNVSINSESINHNNNSDLSKKTFNNFHSSNKSNNNKNIFHTKQETNYEQMENQIEELSRIKLEDIDDLNSLLTSADQSSIDKTVTKQETYSNIKQNSFVPNLFNNVCSILLKEEDLILNFCFCLDNIKRNLKEEYKGQASPSFIYMYIFI